MFFEEGPEPGQITIDEKWKFTKLSPRDRARVMSALKKERRELMRQNLKDAGISGAEYFSEIDAFDQYHFGEHEFLRYMASEDGRAAILEAAYGKVPGQRAEDVANMPLAYDRALPLVAALAGIILVPIESAAEETPTAGDGGGVRDFGGRSSRPDAQGEEEANRPLDAG